MKCYLTSICLLCWLYPANAQVIEQDSLALVALYEATGGDNWTEKENWLTGSPVGDWYGVTVSEGRVTWLILYENNLTGDLPDEIGQLTGLTLLDLASNHLTGTIPESIGNLTELISLELYVNNLNSPLPATLTGCTALEQVLLYRNEMSGPFPEVLLDMPRLRRIELGSNNFAGPIPAAINQLTNLTLLGLDRNNFSGQMPYIGDLQQMREMHLSYNNLEGELDDFMGYFPVLYYFTIDGNNFTGCVREHYFDPDWIHFFDFSANNFDCLGNFVDYVFRLNAHNNLFPFQYLEQNIGVPQFNYFPQKRLLAYEEHILADGAEIHIYSGSEGMHTEYKWFRNNEEIPGATSNSLTIDNFDATKAGTYHCEMTNSMLPNLTLLRNSVLLMPEEISSAHALRNTSLLLSPNPATSFVSWPPTELPVERVFVSDITGRILQTGDIHRSTIDVSGLAPGIYQLHIQAGDKMHIGRFSKTGE